MLWISDYGWADVSSSHRIQKVKAYAKRHDRRIQRRQAACITTQALLGYYDDLEQDWQEQQEKYIMDQYYEDLANQMDQELWEDEELRRMHQEQYEDDYVSDPALCFDEDFYDYEPEPISDYDRGFRAGFQAGREDAIEQLAREEYGMARQYRTEMGIFEDYRGN